jgi:hypothetical protein
MEPVLFKDDRRGATAVEERDSEGEVVADPSHWRYLFRADDWYRGGPIGLAFGPEAESAEIRNFADHVLRKASRFTSRFTSFTKELKIASRFTSAADKRSIRKVEWARLRTMESRGIIRLWEPEQVFEAMKEMSGRLAKQAGDVRSAMRRNSEILIEGQIPTELILAVNE